MLEVKNLSFSYHTDKKLFQNISFTLPEKGIVLINGQNGSGKTTLLRLLSTFIIPSSGHLTFKNQSLTKKMSSLMTSQQDSFFYHLTGQESLELFTRLNQSSEEVWKEQRFQTSQTLQNALTTKFAYCSTGMKQILNFFRTINKKTSFYLFDEPFRALDENTRQLCLDEILRLSSTSLVVITGHESPNDYKYDLKIVLKNGEICLD